MCLLLTDCIATGFGLRGGIGWGDVCMSFVFCLCFPLVFCFHVFLCLFFPFNATFRLSILIVITNHALSLCATGRQTGATARGGEVEAPPVQIKVIIKC